ncbi:MAG: hypothetical protein MI749_21470, partial [Desulfovibrionales bacterium]|nr:hypothetical protein [Desulfovibrionales bacterium]
MRKRYQDPLIQAYKKEKRKAVSDRIHMVCMVRLNGLSAAEAARLCYDEHTVAGWVRKYDDEGL